MGPSHEPPSVPRLCASCPRVSHNRLCDFCYHNGVAQITNAYTSEIVRIEEDIQNVKREKEYASYLLTERLKSLTNSTEKTQAKGIRERSVQLRERVGLEMRLYEETKTECNECWEQLKKVLDKANGGLEADLVELRNKQLVDVDFGVLS